MLEYVGLPAKLTAIQYLVCKLYLCIIKYILITGNEGQVCLVTQCKFLEISFINKNTDKTSDKNNEQN